MFTGLIQEVGKIRRSVRRGGFLNLDIAFDESRGKLAVGDSMAVNGVCLTATTLGDGAFTADLSGQTRKLTTLGDLKPGAQVNLERPVTASAPLGGHIVLGHVDGIGRIQKITSTSGGLTISVRAPEQVMSLVVDKGSISIDGVSLTVGTLGRSSFDVFIIPETLARTTLGSRRPGDPVNLEADYLAKLVKKFIGGDQYRTSSLFPMVKGED